MMKISGGGGERCVRPPDMERDDMDERKEF